MRLLTLPLTERKTSIEVSNRAVTAECHASLSSLAGALEARTSDFRTAHERFSATLVGTLAAFTARQEAELCSSSAYVAQRLDVVGAAFASLRSHQGSSQAHIASVVESVERTTGELATALSGHRSALRKRWEALSDTVQRENAHSIHAANMSFASLGELMRALGGAAQAHVAENQRRLDAMHAAVQSNAQAEVRSLRASVARLESLLAAERGKGEEELAQLAKLLEAAKERRSASLSDTFDAVAASLAAREDAALSFPLEHAAHQAHLVRAGQAHVELVAQQEKKAERLAREGNETAERGPEKVALALGEFDRAQSVAFKAERGEVQGSAASLGKTVADRESAPYVLVALLFLLTYPLTSQCAIRHSPRTQPKPQSSSVCPASSPTRSRAHTTSCAPPTLAPRTSRAPLRKP